MPKIGVPADQGLQTLTEKDLKWAGDNAAEAAAAVQAANEAAATPWPEPEEPESDRVDLVAGLTYKDTHIASASVRELTGADEEALAKSAQALNPFHFLNTLLECGVEKFAGFEKNQTKEILKHVLVGDRDALLMGIRRATYGDYVELEGWVCPGCGEQEETLHFDLDDIPIREGDDSPYDIDLRKGHKARVRPATGADQLAVFDDNKLTIAERDSILLSRCLQSIDDEPILMPNHVVKSMGIADRKKILKTLTEKQPGPQFAELKFKHSCGKEVSINPGIGDLFPDL